MNHLKLFIVLCLACCANVAVGQHNTRIDSFTVAFAGNEPFLVDTSALTGIAPEIWKDVAGKLSLQFHPVFYKDVPQALAAVSAGKADLAVGPISITSDRASRFKFTQPYFQSSLSILSLKNKMNIWQRIRPFFSEKFFIALCFFMLILAIVGTLLWLSERKANPEQFPAEASRGIANGMWCAIVTMTTTGYGDIAPRTFWGRFTAGAWMVTSLIFATSIIAGIASVLTLSGIQTSEVNNADELAGNKIAVVAGSPAEDFVVDNDGKPVEVQNLAEAYQQLHTHNVRAIVFDRPQLLYFMKQHPDYDLSVASAEYNRQGYGFAFPVSSNFVHKVNIALLEMQESGEMQRIIIRWLGKKAY